MNERRETNKEQIGEDDRNSWRDMVPKPRSPERVSEVLIEAGADLRENEK